MIMCYVCMIIQIMHRLLHTHGRESSNGYGVINFLQTTTCNHLRSQIAHAINGNAINIHFKDKMICGYQYVILRTNL